MDLVDVFAVPTDLPPSDHRWNNASHQAAAGAGGTDHWDSFGEPWVGLVMVYYFRWNRMKMKNLFFSFYMKLFAFCTYKIIWTAHRLTDSFICVLIKKAAAFQELILHGWYLHLQIALPHRGNLQPTPGIHHRTTSPASVLYGLCLQIQVSVFTYK